jgi:uncharacterized protein YdhG (YjbR/CyaY superfamily)
VYAQAGHRYGADPPSGMAASGYRWLMDRSAEVDAFLAELPEDLRTALETLRRQIAAAVPGAVETIAYSVPAFKYKGRPLVSFSAGRNGRGPCALYVQNPALMEAHREALTGYDTSKGTIHFTPAEPLASALVTVLVQARMAETDRAGKR